LERSLRGLRWERKFLDRKIVSGRFPKKRRLGPQNGSGSLGPEKLLKIVNCAIIKETENAERNNCGVQVGLGRWPPISTWIIVPTVGGTSRRSISGVHLQCSTSN